LATLVEMSGPQFDIEGHQLTYPTRFRDGSSIMGLFVVPTDAATALLEPSGFRPAEIAPGRSIMSLVCVHYTDTDCGTYDEVAMALFVEMPARRSLPYASTAWRALRGTVASHSWRLGVTTELSRRAGIEMWGFPKSRADLLWTDAPRGAASMSWHDGDTEVMAFTVPATGNRTPRTISPPVLSLIDGVAHIGHLTQTYTGVGHHRRGVTLRLGTHPVSDELRSLGLPRSPLVGVYSSHLRFEMSAPTPL
jgi:hypothetical protein